MGQGSTPTLRSDLLPCLLRGCEGVRMSLTLLGVGVGSGAHRPCPCHLADGWERGPDLGQLAPCRTQGSAGVDIGGLGLGNRVPSVPGMAHRGGLSSCPGLRDTRVGTELERPPRGLRLVWEPVWAPPSALSGTAPASCPPSLCYTEGPRAVVILVSSHCPAGPAATDPGCEWPALGL